jgi:hypothetical protein
MKSGIAKQTVALLVGLGLWALCQYLKFVPQGSLWYVFQFFFPLAIGAAVGYLNQGGPLSRLVLFAALLGIANFAFVRIVNGPLNQGDAMFVFAFSFATLLPALIINQQIVIKRSKQGLADTPANVDVNAALVQATGTIKSLTNLVTAVAALAAAVLGAFGAISKLAGN